MTTARTLVVWVPCRLVNPLNAREHWAVRAKRARVQREAVALAVWKATHGAGWSIKAKPETPKRVRFTAHVSRLMDTDGCVASLKACRDGLQDCGLISSDAPSAGHRFTYRQRVAKPTGVSIAVELA